MKRETEDENLGVQDAMNENTSQITCALDNVINIADPYDGYTRNIPSSLYILPLLAELGFPAFSQGVESVGPKYGCTHHKILKLAGLDVLLSDREVGLIHILYDFGIALVSIDGIPHSKDGIEVHLRFKIKFLSMPGSERISIIESKAVFI